MATLKRRRTTDKLKRRKSKKTSESKLFEAWKLLAATRNTTWYGSHTNMDCLCCSKIAKEMIRVGSLVFCVHCFTKLFDCNAESRNEEQYQKWSKVQLDRWNKELE